ncbi:hypothetical protein GCM10009839_52870 [Catenulispora yoronensis]|uniref:Uncharacterized protein n=2 Tax=Catenulispora yoronensis TaxID=450799 RepID=A0ABP5GEJ3_9ACTN
MPFRRPEPPTRMERMRCAVSGRASDAAQTFSGAAGAAQGAAVTAAGAAQEAAYAVADRAALAAHEVSDRASTAASTVAERARPVAAEAVERGGAAWQILRHGVPRRPSPIARVTSVLPVATVTTVTRRGRAPMALMALGAAGAVGVLLVRRSRMDRDSVWILDEDAEMEPVGRWEEADARATANRRDRSAGTDDADASSSDRKDSPANRWP